MGYRKGVSALASMVALGAIIVLVTGTTIWVENNRTTNYSSSVNSSNVIAAAESVLQDALLKLNLKTGVENYSLIVDGTTVGVCYYADSPSTGIYTIRTKAIKGNITRAMKALVNKDSNTLKFNIYSKEEELDSICEITGATAPTVPLNLVWFSSASSQVTIKWSSPASDGYSTITNYNVYRGVTTGGETLLTTIGNTFTYTDTGLTNNANYYYKVSAVNAIGESPLSGEVLAIPGQAPTGGVVTVSNYASGNYVGATYQISTDFTSSNTATSCDYTTNNGTSWSGATLSGTSPYNCSKTGVTAQDAVNYGINMRMTSNVGVSSATAITKIGDAVDPTVTDNWPDTVWTTTSPVTVTLTPADSGAGVFTTKYCVDTTNACTPSTGTIGTSVSVTCAGTCTQYVSYASWDNVNNASAIYSKRVRQDLQAPTINPTLTATAGNAQISLSWTVATDTGSGLHATTPYKLVYATGATAPANCSSGTQIYLGTALAYTHTGCTNGTQYSYRVCAIDAMSNMSAGTTASATPVDNSNPTCGTLTITPSTTSCVPGTVTTFSTPFTSATTVTSCEYSLNGGTNWYAATLSGSIPNYTCTQSNITGFANGSSYTLNMRATNTGGTTIATALTRTGDTVGPTVSDNWTDTVWTATSPLTVILTPTDACAGVSTTKYCVDTTNTCSPSSGTTGTSVSVTCASSTCTQYVRYASWDNFNNASAVYSQRVRQDQQPPTNPTLTATAGDGHVDLSWTTASDTGSGLHATTPYKVVYATGATPPANCNSGTSLTPIVGTSYPHTGRTNGTQYSYRACAIDAVSNMSTGTTASATPVATYTLTYTACSGGTITGTTPQTVNYGASGTAVTANPGTGYYFVNWSDAVTTATRTDTNVTANKSVTANCALIPVLTGGPTGTTYVKVHALYPNSYATNNSCSASVIWTWTVGGGGGVYKPDGIENLYHDMDSPVFYWTTPGDKTLSVVVTDGTGGSASKNWAYHVYDDVDPLVATGPTAGKLNTDYTFTSHWTGDYWSPLTYSWSGGGTPSSGTLSTFTSQWSTAGTKTVTCWATDYDGQSSTGGSAASVTIYSTPSVSLSGPTTGVFNTDYTYTSTVTGGMTTYTYAWSGGGTPATGANSTFTTRWSADGTKTILLTITDALGQTASGSISNVISTPVSTWVLNSASNQTCTAQCTNIGKSCVGISTSSTGPINSQFYGTNSCLLVTNGVCSTTMSTYTTTCSGHMSSWTYCGCI